MGTLASLAIDLTANSAKLVNELQKANGHLNGFSKQAEQAGRVLKAAFVVATTGMFAHMVKESVDTADKMGKLSQRLGISTEALSQLRHVADLSGVSFNTMTMGLQRMTRRVSEAAAGTGEAKKAMQELNISAAYLNSLAPDRQFEVIAESLSKVSNEGDRVRLAMKFFDSEGVALVQTMANGAKGIREMRVEAHNLGLTLSQEDAVAAAQFNDQMTRAQGYLGALAKEIALNSVTAFNTLTDAFSQVGDQASSSAPDLDLIQEVIKGAGAAAYVAVSAIQALGQGIVGFQLAVIELGKGNIGNAISELGLGFGRVKEEINKAIEAVDRLYNFSGSFPGGEGAEGEGEGGGVDLKPNRITDIPMPGSSGSSVPAFVETALGGTPDDVIAKLEETFMTQEEMLDSAYSRQREMLTENLDWQGEEKERFRQLEAKLNQKHLDTILKQGYFANQKSLKWDQLTNKQKLQTMESTWRKLTAGVASNNETIAKINKAFAIKDAIVNTFRGVSQSLAAYPMPVAAVFAAMHLAAGLATVQQIRSGGSGGGSVGGGSVPALTTPSSDDPFIDEQEVETTKVVTIAFEGIPDDALLTKNQLRAIVDQVNEEKSANVRIAM